MKYKMYINSRHNSSLLNLTLLPFPSRSLLFRFETSNLESLLIQMSENISWIYNISSLLVICFSTKMECILHNFIYTICTCTHKKSELVVIKCGGCSEVKFCNPRLLHDLLISPSQWERSTAAAGPITARYSDHVTRGVIYCFGSHWNTIQRNIKIVQASI